MTDKIKREARERAAATGEPYTRARRAVARQAAAAVAVIDPALLVPYPDEENVTAEELGWRVLPADAGPGQRAHAEAVWRPVRADRPCRCSGPCRHGEACAEEYADDGGQAAPCGGRVIHADRYPGSMFSLTGWEDVYQCDTCGDVWESSVTLSSVPWGEQQTADTPSGPQTVTTVYSGVRHPNFRDPGGDEDDDYSMCPDCLEDPCTCHEDRGCPECGAGGSGDPYGECVCYGE